MTLIAVPPGCIWSFLLCISVSFSRWQPCFFFSSDGTNLWKSKDTQYNETRKIYFQIIFEMLIFQAKMFAFMCTSQELEEYGSFLSVLFWSWFSRQGFCIALSILELGMQSRRASNQLTSTSLVLELEACVTTAG